MCYSSMNYDQTIGYVRLGSSVCKYIKKKYCAISEVSSAMAWIIISSSCAKGFKLKRSSRGSTPCKNAEGH